MATMHFHIAQTGLFMGIYFCIQASQGNIWLEFKIVLGCMVGQIRRPWLVGLMPKSVFYDVCLYSHLIYKAFINISNYANEVIS